MFTAVMVAVALAASGAQGASSAVAPVAPVTAHTLNEETTNASVQTTQVVQPQLYPGLDVHIRPIDPAGDLLPKLFSA